MHIDIIKGFLIFIYFIVNFSVHSQRFGYIESDYIMKQLPEYEKVSQEMDRLTSEWNQEIIIKKRALDSLRNNYLEEEVLLTKEMKDKKQEHITSSEQELRSHQSRTFGYEGLFFLKQKELLQPIQEKIFKAVMKICKQRRIQFMYDKSADYVMVYANPKYDYSDYVLEELGYGDPDDKRR